jgi:hypothetical protein
MKTWVSAYGLQGNGIGYFDTASFTFLPSRIRDLYACTGLKIFFSVSPWSSCNPSVYCPWLIWRPAVLDAVARRRNSKCLFLFFCYFSYHISFVNLLQVLFKLCQSYYIYHCTQSEIIFSRISLNFKPKRKMFQTEVLHFNYIDILYHSPFFLFKMSPFWEIRWSSIRTLRKLEL